MIFHNYIVNCVPLEGLLVVFFSGSFQYSDQLDLPPGLLLTLTLVLVAILCCCIFKAIGNIYVSSQKNVNTCNSNRNVQSSHPKRNKIIANLKITSNISFSYSMLGFP